MCWALDKDGMYFEEDMVQTQSVGHWISSLAIIRMSPVRNIQVRQSVEGHEDVEREKKGDTNRVSDCCGMYFHIFSFRFSQSFVWSSERECQR